MNNDNTRFIPLKTLSEQLISQLEERNFATGTIHTIEIELGHLQDYLSAQGLSGYSPPEGEDFLEIYVRKTYAQKSLNNYKALIRRLDDLYAGREFTWRHSSCETSAPEWCLPLLNSHLENCKKNGNTDKSIIRKEITCRNFFVRLQESGCRKPSDINAEKVYAAVLAEKGKSSPPFIREMLLFLAAQDFLQEDYSTLVPKVHRGSILPTVYTKEEIQKTEAAVDTSGPKGKRDFAILLLTTRLGIRAGDIAGLLLSSIDFDNNELRFIQEKTGIPIALALAPEVKTALADYIDHGRPDGKTNHVFLSVKNPYNPIDRTLVHVITTQYLKAAGIDYKGKKHGPHSFRSSLATAMVNNGMSYDAARKILGHASPESIKHYAALDIESLRKCAVNVPAATGIFEKYLSGKERL